MPMVRSAWYEVCGYRVPRTTYRLRFSFQYRVARKSWHFRMPEIDRKEDRHRHGLSAQFRRNEPEVMSTGNRRRIECAVAARFIHAGRIRDSDAVYVDEE